ncbi:uncharacterized protein CELE_Y67A10A.3 [Caenorhabditis elegans]|uniref:Domain of unknown function WSN domain-containing protein n=1 Tax=Caenorhabditis elegans TaxID=6239 RepID=K8ERN2_CAEEL|nr:protein of unknown function WSN domain-containing protein [Caenorhabditis elegans]CCO25593.1 Domain of unknown function WSN domain-containing protein [Caenorhabditis elegans]|eukprot:NP_001263814.1 Uncharacterized protein CELE_Y67A10A.3 [Caenorhabditis elegans]
MLSIRIVSMIFLISLAFNCSNTLETIKNVARSERDTGQGSSSSLQQMTDDFSSLARLLNGILLQQLLTDGSLVATETIADLFNIPNGKAIERVIATDVHVKSTSKLVSFTVDHVSKLAENAINASVTRDQFETLSSIIQRFNNLANVTDNSLLLIEMLPKDLNLKATTFQPMFRVLTSIKETLSTTPSKTVSDSLKEFQSLYDTFHSQLFNMFDLDRVAVDVLKLKDIIKKNSAYAEMTAQLSSTRQIIHSLVSRRETATLNYVGFPKGIEDLAQIKDDLSGTWLKEKLASQKSMSELSKHLELIHQLPNELKNLSSSWDDMRNASTTRMPLTDALIFQLGNFCDLNKHLAGISDIEKRTKSINDIVNELKDIPDDDALKDFDKFYELKKSFEDISDRVESLKGFLAELECYNITRDDLKAIVVSINNAAGNAVDNLNDTQILDRVRKIRKTVGFIELWNITHFFATKLPTDLEDKVNEIVGKTIQKESLDHFQKSLKNSGLETVSKKFANVGYNGSSIVVNLLEFINKARKIDTGALQEIPGILRLLEKLKNDFVAAVEQVNTKKTQKAKQRRAAQNNLSVSPISRSLVLDFANGVIVLRKMSEVYEKSEIVSAAASSADDVNNLISGVPVYKSSWTKVNRDGMIKLVDDLKKLEKYAKDQRNDKHLKDVGELFKKIFEIKGVPIDASDFAKYDVAIVKAYNSLPQILQYFQEMFPVRNQKLNKPSHPMQTNASNLVSNHDDGDEGQSGGLVYIIIAVSIFLLVPVIIFFVLHFLLKRFTRKLDYLTQLNDPETWVLLSFTPENIPQEFQEPGYAIPAFKHLHNDNIDEFKKSLAAGAYVDAKVQSSKSSNTLLHESVSLGQGEYVKQLLKYGASCDVLNHDQETPLELAEKLGHQNCIKVLKMFEGKTFDIVLPQQLNQGDYNIRVEQHLREESGHYDGFCKKYLYLMDDWERPFSHFVVKTDSEGVWNIVENEVHIVFCAAMVMSESWLKACVSSSSNIAGNKKYRVTRMTFQGKEYGTLLQIKDFFNRMNVPYLFGTNVTLYNSNFNCSKWDQFQHVLTELGVSPEHLFDGKWNWVRGPSYHRKDYPKNFFVHFEADYLKTEWDYKNSMFEEMHNEILSTDELIHFLLAFEINSEKVLETNAKNKKLNGLHKAEASSVVKSEKEKKKNKRNTADNTTTTGATGTTVTTGTESSTLLGNENETS